MNSSEIVLAVQGMHCASCGMLIDETLEDLPGVHTSTTSVRAATTTVRLDPSTCTVDTLVVEIATLGYTAQPAHR
jgi:copper chaperone